MDILPNLLDKKMKAEGLSGREVARRIGVSATTIARVLDGESVDVDTLLRLCKWMDVSPAAILDAQLPSRSGLSAKIAAVVQANPALAEVFDTAFEKLAVGEIDISDIQDVAAYAAYRLKLGEGKKVDSD